MTRIIFFGASTGYGAWDEEGGWVDRLKRFCHKRFMEEKSEKFVLYNLGVTGKSTKDMVMRFEPELKERLKEQEETVLLIEAGTNDSRFVQDLGRREVDPDRFRDNMKKIIAIARKHSEKIIIIGTRPVIQKKTDPFQNKGHCFRNKDLEEYNAILRDVCNQEGIPFVDMFDSFDQKLIFRDGLHPNTEGHKMIFESVKGLLLERGFI